jgi:hemerythrin-like domain-containing protein
MWAVQASLMVCFQDLQGAKHRPSTAWQQIAEHQLELWKEHLSLEEEIVFPLIRNSASEFDDGRRTCCNGRAAI